MFDQKNIVTVVKMVANIKTKTKSKQSLWGTKILPAGHHCTFTLLNWQTPTVYRKQPTV